MRQQAFLLVLAAVLVSGCTGGPKTTQFVERPDLLRLIDVDIHLVDLLGLTERLWPVPATLDGPFVRGIEPVPGQPRELIIPWTGLDCDVSTTLTLHRADDRLVMSVSSISRPPSGVLCTLGGRLNAVIVRFLDVAPVVELREGG